MCLSEEKLEVESHMYTLPMKNLSECQQIVETGIKCESQPRLLTGGIWWIIETGNALPSGNRFRQHIDSDTSETPDPW